MGKINVARVILGGLLAGLVMNVGEYVLNIYVVAEESAALLEQSGVPQIGAQQIGAFVALSFALGLVMVFVYAAMRPRFGAGTKTAVIAGATVWIVFIFASVADLILGIISVHLLLLTGVWTLVEIVVATIAGAWLYQEA